MPNDIDAFVAALAGAEPPPRCANPYEQPAAAANLRRFLAIERRDGPRLLFVGEAPGYRGAAVSGVPFASLAILTRPWGDPWGAFGPASGFAAPPGRPHMCEATATNFWRSLASALRDGPLPFTWNAFPFHPQRAGRPGNRPPTAREVEAGRDYLERMLEMFAPERTIAVGKRAALALTSLGMAHAALRHPSHGGAADFEAGLRAL